MALPGKVLIAFGEDHGEGEEMERIRRDCFAASLGERDKFCAGVAAPVFTRRDRLMGALSLSGPKERFMPEDVERMKGPLQAAARELTKEMGGMYPV